LQLRTPLISTTRLRARRSAALRRLRLTRGLRVIIAALRLRVVLSGGRGHAECESEHRHPAEKLVPHGGSCFPCEENEERRNVFRGSPDGRDTDQRKAALEGG
jgi:hypothetical protein